MLKFLISFATNLKKIKDYFSTKIFNLKNAIEDLILIKSQPILHTQALKNVRLKSKNKQPIKTVFFVERSSIWKYEAVYQFFEKDKRFEPLIVILPIVNYGPYHLLLEMEKSFKYFSNKNYNVIYGYDKYADQYLDVKEQIKPDIIFYTRPYWVTMHPSFYIKSFCDVLTCYVNYSYNTSVYEKQLYDELLPSMVWKFFLATKIHYKEFKQMARSKGKNGLITGYPGVDLLKYNVREEIDIWKVKDPKIKRIIWAPHHTVLNESFLKLSSFQIYADFMLETALKYKDHIQISFKPHPMLKATLAKNPSWNQDKIESYFKKWEEIDNTQLNTDDYIELFNSSDALIHDCSSFAVEYLHTGKPVLFLSTDQTEAQFREFGIKVYKHHYHAFTKKDIENFIMNVVIEGKDTMKEKRDSFYNEYLIPPNGGNASKNIYDYICQQICE